MEPRPVEAVGEKGEAGGGADGARGRRGQGETNSAPPLQSPPRLLRPAAPPRLLRLAGPPPPLRLLPRLPRRSASSVVPPRPLPRLLGSRHSASSGLRSASRLGSRAARSPPLRLLASSARPPPPCVRASSAPATPARLPPLRLQRRHGLTGLIAWWPVAVGMGIGGGGNGGLGIWGWARITTIWYATIPIKISPSAS